MTLHLELASVCLVCSSPEIYNTFLGGKVIVVVGGQYRGHIPQRRVKKNRRWARLREFMMNRRAHASFNLP